MFDRPDIRRLEWSQGRIAHLRMPPVLQETHKTVALPGAIAIGYNGLRGAIVRLASGRTIGRDVAPGSVGMTGGEPVEWVRTNAPTEVVEVCASAALRQAVACELGVEAHADLADLHGWSNLHAWAIVDRLRAVSDGSRPLADVSRDTLLRQLYAVALAGKFGGRLVERHKGALDPVRLTRVIDFIEAHLAEELTLECLAQVACLSTFHFARAFKGATGLAPHQFVTARRLEWARLRLRSSSDSFEVVAAEIGYTNVGHFRRLFRARIGLLPSQIRAGQ
ncbi:AraC family transcriptional regulator [Sphingomonas sp. BT-65]|uniref:helix-turn-helix domain-containing protein n=1 Tax=Sphingomonas sp. BT-65 TaxID=2989821 RepID=UPI0022362432|nr:AraC family transcriptional regulator [Sphingomonas sp. BT-65]MCW4460724.1 AraC family transcriptional regulator [Sphingomonas sp. BT-65]